MNEAAARCADEFFRATAADDWEAALAVAAPDMILRQSDGRAGRFADSVPYLRSMRATTGPWEYLDVRRLVTNDGFCEQHVVRFHGPDGGTSDYDVCAVGRIDSDGRMTRLDEYVCAAPKEKG